MNRGGHHLHCIVNLLRLRDGMIVVAIALKAGQEIESAGREVGVEPLASWLRRHQRLRKPLKNTWGRVDERVRSA
ncbi:MAG: hypothetical protein EOR30_32205 [Mesorhizobium sp.]|uniref:hypothetical protein n=1 Tax=Mesorhizobium sp. TaxID=1871066 RepID=UPI000FE7BAC6|nr:hypothetical protein [Mesorhizobium sp.]RWI37086.1 MAG: hypothetical protein EOR14_26130 [Mesorhizobium sp.]RWI61324.1 MAG: hypothetical protein EOR17_34960 [Mesorhizobium sp.]RWI81434.1 MAG: hypothetical protein EOR20_32385 [Mesorhizobium sp.]RWJ42407.1 MAG: hypothetical protein EOR30_32205 [Mesorhizobium sp.]RWJ57361.1 MAG: hypothetical protein EOR32_30165 [Mesorhizobium sp.]